MTVLTETAVPTVEASDPGKPRLSGLQVLRFVAAFAVVLFHVGSGLQTEFGQPTNLFAFGAAGVDIFFVISGFIIAYTADPAKGALTFVQRRLVRILPLYWTLTFGVIALALIMPQLLNSTTVNGETILKSLFFIPFQKQNGFVQPILFLGWTLNYEMFFYAVYASAIALGLRTPIAPALFIIALVVLGRLFPGDNVLWRFYTNPLILEFAFGMALYALQARFGPRVFGNGLALLGLFAVSLVLRELIPNLHWVIANGIPATLLVAAVLPWQPARSVTLSALVLLGDASYSLYLSHPYIIQVFIKLLPDQSGILLQVMAGAVSCFVSIGVAILLYKLIEQPSLAWLADRRGLRVRRQ